MKRKSLFALLCALLLCALSVTAFASGEDIVILYENDVHCEVEGYSKLASMKKELQETHDHVGVVSSGDYIQGNSLGVMSQGEYIINLMNIVGYDAVTLGNHEFDFRLDRLYELVEMMDTKPICCNFQKIGEEQTCFEPWSLVEYGEVTVGYIGITTPETMSVTSSGQMKDDQGNFLYTFHAAELCETVQQHIDAAAAAGADYIIALAHMGDQEPKYNIDELVAGVRGLDVVLDAHSHSVIEGQFLRDMDGKEVLHSSTGTKFEYIGKLTLSDGTFTTELIKTEDYTGTDAAVDRYLEEIYEESAQLGERKVAVSEVELITHDEEGNRLVRCGETNMGDLIADALRVVLDADIAYMNGGGIRTGIQIGDVTYNDLMNVMPFNNQPVALEAKGQDIWNMLELTTRAWPEEEGSFPHVSGLTFSVNTAIPTSVVVDEEEMFVEVAGEYRVYDVRVLDRESGKYEPLDPEKYYSLAGQNYSLQEGGSGINMFYGAEILHSAGALDVEVLERYLAEHLQGVIGQEYAEMTPNITFTEGERSGVETKDMVIAAAVCAVCIGAAVIAVVAVRRKRAAGR